MRISDWSSDVCSSDLDHLDRLEPFHRAQHRELNVGGERSRNPIRIDEEAVEPLGFEKHLMPVAVGEAVDLVLDRRAVTRPRRPDRAREQGRSVEIRRDARSEEHTSELQSLMRTSYA